LAESDLQEKTEKATPKKRRDAKKKGQVAKSREVASVAVLMAGLSTLSLFGSMIYGHIRCIMHRGFSMIATPTLGIADLLDLGHWLVQHFIVMVAPVMIAVVAIGVLSNVLQTGTVASWEPIRPKLSHLDPIKGTGRLFSKQSVMELFKSLAKLSIVSGIAYWTVKGEIKHFLSLSGMDVSGIAVYILKVAFKIYIRVSVVMIFLAVIDYAFQKWQFEQQMKMTKQEVKEEFKQTEGDPLTRSRIKRIQFEMAKRRMMQEVPKADVVVTNPVHLALAIRYDSAAMNAPEVVAKGAGEVAQKIKEIAAKHRVPIVENKELARHLYRMVEIGSEIPSALYQAVAEVLAYVYRLKGKGSN